MTAIATQIENKRPDSSVYAIEAVARGHTRVAVTDLDRLLPIKEVVALTSLSRATIYRRFPMTFPAPVKCGAARVAWRRSDIEKWLAGCKTVGKFSAAA